MKIKKNKWSAVDVCLQPKMIVWVNGLANCQKFIKCFVWPWSWMIQWRWLQKKIFILVSPSLSRKALIGLKWLQRFYHCIIFSTNKTNVSVDDVFYGFIVVTCFAHIFIHVYFADQVTQRTRRRWRGGLEVARKVGPCWLLLHWTKCNLDTFLCVLLNTHCTLHCWSTLESFHTSVVELN